MQVAVNTIATQFWPAFGRGLRQVVFKASEPARLPGRFSLPVHLICLAISGVLLTLALQGGVTRWTEVIVLLSLTIATSFFWITTESGSEYTCSDLFFTIALATLPLADAALVTAGVVLFLMIEARSWQSSVNSVVAFNSTCGLFAAHFVLAHSTLSLAPTTALAVFAAYAGMRAGEIPVRFTLHMVEQSTPLRLRLRDAWKQRVTNEITQLKEQILLYVALGTLGALATHISVWAAFCVLVPYLSYWRDTQNMFKLQAARRLAQVDKLTGLSNRAGFFELALDELESARKGGHTVTMIMGDLDNFKQVNDKRGHLVGDDVLVLSSKAIQTAIGDGQIIGRYGGEEFVILISHVSFDSALEYAEKVRVHVEQALETYSSSISLGVASFDRSDRLETLIDRADKALYSAKYAGKNRVHVFGRGDAQPVDAAA